MRAKLPTLLCPTKSITQKQIINMTEDAFDTVYKLHLNLSMQTRYRSGLNSIIKAQPMVK